MECELAGRAMWSAGALRTHHVGESEPSALRRIAMRQGHIGPVIVTGAPDLDRTAKGVRIGHRQGRLRAVHLDEPIAGGRTSKLATIVEIGPDSCSTSAPTWVGTSTSIIVPASGWLVIGRVAREIRTLPVTRVTAPSNDTSAVR